jgi:hypothetical protein
MGAQSAEQNRETWVANSSAFATPLCNYLLVQWYSWYVVDELWITLFRDYFVLEYPVLFAVVLVWQYFRFAISVYTDCRCQTALGGDIFNDNVPEECPTHPASRCKYQ